MGKVTQLTFGALSPGAVDINLMSANITANLTVINDVMNEVKRIRTERRLVIR